MNITFSSVQELKLNKLILIKYTIKMNKLKKNWKEILIVLLILFGMNKCTVSCNRGSKLNKANQEILYKDSLNKAMTDSIKSLNVTIANLTDKNGMLSEFNRQQTKSDSLNRVAQKEQLNQVKNMVNRLKRK